MRNDHSEIEDYDYNHDDVYNNNESVESVASNQPNEEIVMSSNEITEETSSKSMFQEGATYTGNENIDITLPLEEQLPGSYPMAILGGALSSAACIALWTMVTVMTQYQIGYMAIGVGFAVGFLVQYMGKGTNMIFGVIGSAFALIACIFGNLFSQIIFIADMNGESYVELIKVLDLNNAFYILKYSFHPMDIVFYLIAISTAFKISFNNK